MQRPLEGLGLAALVSFLMLSHDTELQDGGNKTSSESGKGLSFVCIWTSFQVGKGIFM